RGARVVAADGDVPDQPAGPAAGAAHRAGAVLLRPPAGLRDAGMAPGAAAAGAGGGPARRRRGRPDPPGRVTGGARTVHRVSAEQQRSWLSWWDGSPRSLLFDLAVALAPVAGKLYSHGGRLGDTSLPALAFLATGFLALLVRRRFPFPAAVVAALVNLPAGRVEGVAEIALYTVASRRGPRPVTWVAAGVSALVTVFGLAWPGELVGQRAALAASMVLLS